MVLQLFHSRPFVLAGHRALIQDSSDQKPETSATSVGCMGIGPRNARTEGTVTSQLPEDLLHKRNSDILQVVRPLVKHWRKDGIKITVYLDDGLALAEEEQVCAQQAIRVKHDLILSGFVPNKDKCIWRPVQNLVWLGFIWDLKLCLFQLLPEKVANLVDLAGVILEQPHKVKIRLLAKFCGKIISFTPVIGNVTQIMTRCIFSVINSRDEWDQFVDLNFYSGSIREILFWRQNIVSLKPVAILREISDFKVFTDASDGAAAGFVANSDYIMHKQWLKHEAIKSSTWRELKAIELSIDSFKHLLSNSLVSFFTDNQNAVGIIQKGSKVPELQTLALSIFSICVSCNISLHPEWIPREDNEKADALSRIVDIDDWGISFEFFNFIDRLWGLHTVDRFANMNNAKLGRFNSLFWNPGTSAIDAFTCNWKGDNNWLVPPVNLVSKCINHLINCTAVGTLIVPKWPSSAFWPLLFKENLEYAWFVRDVLEFHEIDRILVAGNNKNSMFANGTFNGLLLAVRLDASQMN
ncbi:Hypothetical predicted protein [Mytilus galloprovincialis]|uniref:Reverse transcriptase domain-containing protein n=1 Tax=Mytilus galloprovincialis TaxID=29158 RepID=A0A8B6FKY4_MYTGA|nr:Hypothetical predicted protein [Mytilus galloprovincialis]